MKKSMTVLLIAGFAALLSPFQLWAGGPPKLKEINESDVQKIEEALPDKPMVAPRKEHRLLVLWKCGGYFHGSIHAGCKAFEIMGEKTGAFKTEIPQTQSGQLDYFTPEKLQEFDAVMFNNTTRLGLNKSQQKALMDYVKSGGGIVGVHAATDNFYNWPEGARMMGGQFSGHPWNQKVPVKVDDPDHKLCSMFDSRGFEIKDEIYQFTKGNYSRHNQRVLLSLDYDKMNGKKGGRKDDDYAISWVKRIGKGRLFYCSLGHYNEVFWNPAVLRHLLAGTQFALGDLDVETDPQPLGLENIDPYTGIYEGTMKRKKESIPAEAKVIPRGNGSYLAVLSAPPATEDKEGVRLELRNAEAMANMPVYTTRDCKERGVKYAYYEGNWNKVPDFEQLTPVKTGKADFFLLDPRKRDDHFAFKYEGFIKIDEPGEYSFATTSDDGSVLHIDGEKVVDNDGTHGARTVRGKAKLKPGVHSIVVSFFESSGGETLKVAFGKISESSENLAFSGKGQGSQWKGEIDGDQFVVSAKDAAEGEFDLEKTNRESPTLGLEPPKGAIQLLPIQEDSKPSLEKWTNNSWKALPDGSIQVVKGHNFTRAEFGDMRMHLEFMCPYQPSKRGQGRGNSGVYVQKRYELQVLDSFGLEPAWNGCGGIYKVAVPRVNAELPPLHWQTYDIVFQAPRIGANGQVEKKPVLKEVKLNGVLIHKDVEIPHPTTASAGKGHKETAALMLQDHGHPVRYRNIWIEPMN